MMVEYSKRATADLRALGAASRQQFGEAVAAEIEAFFRRVVAHIQEDPQSRPKVFGRNGVHMAVLVRYPFKMFYRVLEYRIRLLHVRHTSQRPWEGN
jgi:toxin ParE1/3/4